MSDSQENLKEILNAMVEVKGYKYPLSVCAFVMDGLPNLTEINSLTGKSFRLPTKDELRYILSETSGIRSVLQKREAHTKCDSKGLGIPNMQASGRK